MSTEIIHDAITGEITERTFSAAELKAQEAKRVEQEKIIAQQEAEKTARAAVLSKLGLTAEEAALLLS